MDKYLVLAFMLSLGIGGAAVNFVSAHYYPHWTIYHGRTKIPMSVRGKIEVGSYFAYWTLMIILSLVWAPFFYLSIPGFFYMLWRCGWAYYADKRAFEAAERQKQKSDERNVD